MGVQSQCSYCASHIRELAPLTPFAMRTHPLAVVALGLSALLSVPRLSFGHPQCLDFLPPFIPEQRLAYCTQYDAYSCCTARSEGAVKIEVARLASLVNSTSPQPNVCEMFVRNISCSRCSPYASHVYDAESTGRATAFAGLCTTYCAEFYRACGVDVAKAIARISQNSSLTSAQFCQMVQLTDKDYCYPDVINFEQRQLQRNNIQGEG